MILTKEQIRILEDRKKELRKYDTWAIIIIIIYAIIVGTSGLNLLTIIIGIILIIIFPSYRNRKKELAEIEFKLAGKKEKS